MKIAIMAMMLLLTLSACSKKTALEIVVPPAPTPPIHLPLDATAEEYQSLLKEAEENNVNAKVGPVITKTIQWGTRLTSWLATLNAGRSEADSIRLSSASAQKNQAIPIDSPTYNSEALLEKQYNDLKKALPSNILEYLEGGPVPATPDVVSKELQTLLMKVNTLYEQAARFKLLYPYLDYYKEAKTRDVRPYFFFINKKWNLESFKTMTSLPIEEQKVINEEIQKLCETRWDVKEGENRKNRCVKLIADAQVDNTLSELWFESMLYGKALWNTFFDLSDSRKDVNHTDRNMLIIPFKKPYSALLAAYLKDNVEDEFRYGDWALKVNFNENATAHLVFESGTVPHVNELSGDEIVMDENESIEEFSSKWTIRHEFGHILGLPDCYHEFYDEETKAFVNYQLDVDDLMCSRAGKMKERIKTELQKAYHTGPEEKTLSTELEEAN